MQNYNQELESSNASASNSSEDLNKKQSEKNVNILAHRVKLRSATAAQKPNSQLEEFKRSKEFLMIEHCVLCSERVVQKSDHKFDLESGEGNKAAKRFLNQLENLASVFGVTTQNRDQRVEFSKAQRILQAEGALCQLTEIIDSAQEGFPFLWVNGEKQVFSRDVLDAGRDLQLGFCEIKEHIQTLQTRILEENYQKTTSQISNDICKLIEEFDNCQVGYEQIQVLELMVIEADARRQVTELIDLEREMLVLEVKEKARGRNILQNEDYRLYRKRVIHLINQINSVANVEGKGRDDLDEAILYNAEMIVRKQSKNLTQFQVVNMGNQIKQTQYEIRLLLRKQEQNIEQIDPQLKNNHELVECLQNFESSWEKGKIQLSSAKDISHLIAFRTIVEQLKEKQRTFLNDVECMDVSVFLQVPNVLVFLSLDNRDQDLCNSYFSPLSDKNCAMYDRQTNLKSLQNEQRAELGIDWNIVQKHLEQSLLDIDSDVIQDARFRKIVNEVKNLSLEVQRWKPQDWNQLLNVVLGM